ncbi:MAG: ParB/RepB/Spo0J family partition protein [Myxococcaceae bacterium]
MQVDDEVEAMSSPKPSEPTPPGAVLEERAQEPAATQEMGDGDDELDVAADELLVDDLDEDFTFRMRDEGELSLLATDIARLGQLFPIDVRPSGEGRYQVICGFRRLAAIKFLQREKVQARLHDGLSDEDALLMALASTIHAEPLPREGLESLKGRLEREGRLFSAAQDMLERALMTEDPLAPETVGEDGTPVEVKTTSSNEEEIDADELADDVTLRLGEINQDLALLADVFSSLDDGKRQELLTQLRYSSDLVAFLEGK